VTVSLEEALLLFNRWSDESASVRVKYSSGSVIFEGVGAAELNGNAVEFRGDAWRLILPLERADFVFSDPREIPVRSVRDAESAQYEFGMAINLANGDRVTLLEMKQE
jgi:hypothetical protein